MEKVRKVVKKYYLRQIMTYWLACWMFFGLPAQVAMAAVSGGDFQVGTGQIVNGAAGTVLVDQLESVIHWDSLDTILGESLTFSQMAGLSNSAVLNRVVDEGALSATSFGGELSGTDMRIFMVNPAGIIFTDDASINVSQLVASSLDMLDTDFLAGNMVFQGGGGMAGIVKNQGTIKATDSVYLVGSDVFQNGTIDVPNGDVVLVAAFNDKVTITRQNSDVHVEFTPEVTPALATSTETNYTLGSGDIFSSALTSARNITAKATRDVTIGGIINAYDKASSDAVASIDIIAGGDVTVNSNITANTYATTTGVSTDDALSTIDIHADGTVNVNSLVKAYSESRNGSGNAESTVTIDADRSVNINGHVEAYAKAKYGSGDALATVNLTADESVNVHDGVLAYARTKYDGGNSTALVDIDAEFVDISGNVESKATVKDGSGNAKADVQIYSDWNVLVNGGEGDALVKSYTRTSRDSGNATSKTTVEAGYSVFIEAGSVEAWAETEDSSSGNAGNLTALVDIDAGAELWVGYYDDYEDGHIFAVAKTGEYANEGDIGDITATVDIDAGLVDVDYGNIAAVAKTGLDSWVNAGDITATVEIDTVGYSYPVNDEYFVDVDGDVIVREYDYGDFLGADLTTIEAHAEAGSGISGTAGNITAKVDIDADGYLDVDGSGIQAEAMVGYQQWAEAGNLEATVNILTGGDVRVYNGSIQAKAHKDDKSPADIGDSKATVIVDAGGNVEVTAESGESSADILAEATDGVNNTADVQITATATTSEYLYEGDEQVYNKVDGGNVIVNANNGGHAQILARAADAVGMDDSGTSPTSNTANVTINATSAEGTMQGKVVEEPVYDGRDILEPGVYEEVTYTEGGNVAVTASNYSHAGIAAEAQNADDNTASVEINADDTVLVLDMYGNAYTAEVKALAENAYNSNTADVLINANNVIAAAVDGNVRIKARAANIMMPPYPPSQATFSAGPIITEPDGTENNASVRINASASDGYNQEGLLPCLLSMIPEDIVDENPQLESFLQGLIAGGHVVVGSINGGSAQILAETNNPSGTGTANTSDVLICAEGGVLLGALSCGEQYTDAQIKALAHFGYSSTADVGIRAPLGLGVLAVGPYANASIASEAMYGHINQADLVACTNGPALVLGILNDGPDSGAEIISEAKYGYTYNNAYTGVTAGEDIIVGAYEGKAMISSEAYGYKADRVVSLDVAPDYPDEPVEPTTADATTVVVSKRGIVGVVDYDNSEPGTAGIVSEAHGAELNNAYTGVLAGADGPSQTLLGSLLDQFDEEINGCLDFDLAGFIEPGSVYVAALGSSGHSMILSEAYDGDENTAETVVAAPGEVVVITEHVSGQQIAQIKSMAGEEYEESSLNTATTRIYASEVTVNDKAIVQSLADSDEKLVSDYVLTRDGEVVEEGDATIIIQGYSKRTDLPTSAPCPDCDLDGPIPPPPAPLGAAPLPTLLERVFGQGGCPALMEWLANELGVGVDVKVFVAGAFVSSTDCQPCETAARLKAAATVLTDEDGSHMAAMNQVFNPNVPFTPEMANSIATDAGEQYALAREYIDALVQYIAILNTEMGSPVADPIAYVMTKYGSGITGSGNADMSTFVASRLESGETYAQ